MCGAVFSLHFIMLRLPLIFIVVGGVAVGITVVGHLFNIVYQEKAHEGKSLDSLHRKFLSKSNRGSATLGSDDA